MAAHIIRGRMRRTVTLVAAAAAGLAGCGGDDGGGPATTVPAGKPIAVTADEYSFSPKNLVVKGASKVTIQLKNDGAQAHDLRVLRAGEDVGGTPTFGPGQTKTATVALSRGEYEII